jgi:glycosyltransferase involved in cell wall biosynthesis
VNIAFVTLRLLLGYGVDLVVHNLAARMAERKHTVTVYTMNRDEAYADAPYAVRTVEVPGSSANRAFPVFERNALATLRRTEHDAHDVVVACTFPFYCVKRAWDLPTVHFHFGNAPTTGFSRAGKMNWVWLERREARVHLRDADAIFAISKFLQSCLPQAVRGKSRVIYPGGDHYLPAPSSDAREVFRREIGLQPDDVAMLYVGRLKPGPQPYKGVRDLVDVYESAKRHCPRLHLVMAGIGDAQDETRLKSQDVIALRNLPAAKMPALYASCDFYATASKWEGFDLPIVEAAHFGKPSVALSVGAHMEITTNVLAASLLEFADGVRRLASDDAFRASEAKKAFKRAQAFTWATAADAFEHGIMQMIIGSSK